MIALAWSRGSLEPVPACPACASAHRHPLEYRRRDNDGVLPDTWRMVRCANCESLYLDPRPDAASLPRAYEDYFTHDAEVEATVRDGARGLGWRLIHGYLNRRFGMRRTPELALGRVVLAAVEPWRLKLDYYGRHLTDRRIGPGRLLDIGCGSGAFLQRAREMGWDASGCEPDPVAAAGCRERGLAVLGGDAFDPALDGQSFDAITMSHVIEHVQDAPALLRRAHALLRPGGLLWLALPNPQGLGLRVFGPAWNGLHVPFHLCIPSAAVLRRWLTDAGFAQIVAPRRGSHARSFWTTSLHIARAQGIPMPSAPTLGAMRVLADLLATFTPRWAEETVLMARKPDRADGA